ncbi:MAG: hypothetical protein EOP90_03890 [Lysobacteraceae bacterium]|nr:MAG: hypothetical protein EOP90_03890 [Xanthomonadaceae bacterium]
MKRRNPLIRSAFVLMLPVATLTAIAFEAPVSMSVQQRPALEATLLPTVHVVAAAAGSERLAVAPEEALSVTLLPTVYVHARIAEYAGVEASPFAFAMVGPQPECVPPTCASAR